MIPRDIAHRKRTEEDLAMRRAQLEEAQALAHLGSWSWDIPTGTLTWSDELYRIFGLEKKEFSAAKRHRRMDSPRARLHRLHRGGKCRAGTRQCIEE